MTSAYARYLTDATYDLNHALKAGMTDDEYIAATDPYNDDRWHKMLAKDTRFRGGKHHRTAYFMGRRHILFTGKVLRSMRVYQWLESEECYREIFDRF